ncbi:10801_t:CDS:2 [Entrophospora sp. SA101]|nr:10801_t:CDS:2 [Entrophospora sp. SA101]
MLSFLKLAKEQPAMISTLSTIASLPVPDIYLAYNGTFTITCTKGSSSVEGDCNDYVTQPTRGDNPNLQYAGKFLPRNQIRLLPKGVGSDFIILRISVDKPTSPGNFISMHAFDTGNEGSVANNKNEEPFTESLVYANRHYLSGGLDYHLTYSRKVRKTIANMNLNFIGLTLDLEIDYNTQKYIESKMQIFPKDDLNSPFIKLEISPQNFISEEFKEQRSNTVISVLGTIFGYYRSLSACDSAHCSMSCADQQSRCSAKATSNNMIKH